MPAEMNEVFQQLVSSDEISWKEMIYESVRSGEMNPWDIDISFIATKFGEMLQKLKEMNFMVSGKVVLASVLLLKLKSKRFLDEDIVALEQLIASTEVDDEEYLEGDEYEYDELQKFDKVNVPIRKRTPLARKRKVSVYDLIEALDQALNTSTKRQVRERINAPVVVIPEKGMDISMSMDRVYETVQQHFKNNNDLTFAQLIPSQSKNDKIFTFIPLLHLRNAKKLDLHQQAAFSDFAITSIDAKAELEAELAED